MSEIAIATCLKYPGLTPSDQIFADALAARGANVVAAPWNGAFAPFDTADLTVVRSTWDYFDVTNDFLAWIARFEEGRAVLNPPAVLRWSLTKDYLFELGENGAPVPPMRRIAPKPSDVGAAMTSMNLDVAIVKPLSGGTASGLSRVRAGDHDAIDAAASILNGDGMVMPFLPEIETLGETSFVFLGGAFSHAVLKTPKEGDIRVQEDHGGVSRLIDAPDWAVKAAAQILTMCPSGGAYARVDAIVHDDRLTLMEVELVEPELFFTLRPNAAAHLATIVLGAA